MSVTNGNNKTSFERPDVGVWRSLRRIETPQQNFVMQSRPVIGQTVDAVESRVVVDAEINQADGFDKAVNLVHFARAKSVKGAVDDFIASEVGKDANTKRRTIVPVVFEGDGPFGDFGVKVGRLLVGAKMNFHFFLWVAKSGNVPNALKAYHYTKKYYSKFVRTLGGAA